MVKRNIHVLNEGEKVKLAPKVKRLSTKTKNKAISGSEENYLKLAELVDNSRILFRATTVFPFDFFPDELIIDKDKIAIITKYFILSDRYQSILVKNVSDVYVDNSIFFSALFLTDKYFADSSIRIDYLWKKDAVRARDIIQGLIICHEQGVDISGMKREEVLPYLEEIGKATAK